MGQRAIPSWISRHSYLSAAQTVKNKKLDHRVIIGTGKNRLKTLPIARSQGKRARESMVRCCVCSWNWKKGKVADVLGVALTSIWNGGSHESSTYSTVQPAEVPGWADAGGDGRAPQP